MKLSKFTVALLGVLTSVSLYSVSFAKPTDVPVNPLPDALPTESPLPEATISPAGASLEGNVALPDGSAQASLESFWGQNGVLDANPFAFDETAEAQEQLPNVDFFTALPGTLVADTHLYVNVINAVGTHEQILVQNVRGEDFLFLPANASFSQMMFGYDPGIAVFIDNGETMVLLEENIPVDVYPYLSKADGNGVRKLNFTSIMSDGTMNNYSLNIMQSSNVPSMFIKSKDPVKKGLAYVYEIKGNKGEGDLDFVGADGAVIYSGSLTQIKGRGNSTWAAYKRPFQIKLGQSFDMLQTGDNANKSKTWILLANAFDATLLRNTASFDMAKAMGVDAPDSRFTDLYFDGIYMGSYLLSEKVEEGKGRVNIDKNGFLIEMDSAYYAQEDYYFVDAVGTPFVVKAPEEPNNLQMQYITEYMNNAITAAANGGVNPNTGLSVWDYIDKDSLVKYYVLEELTKDPDAFVSSAFFYLPAGGKLVAGPAWDYDSSFGVVMLKNNNLSSGLMTKEGWIGYFLSLPDFNDAVKDFMKNTASKIGYNELKIITSDSVLIEKSRKMNDMLWKGVDAKYYTLPSYKENLVYLKNFINKRVSYLSNNIGK